MNETFEPGPQAIRSLSQWEREAAGVNDAFRKAAADIAIGFGEQIQAISVCFQEISANMMAATISFNELFADILRYQRRMDLRRRAKHWTKRGCGRANR